MYISVPMNQKVTYSILFFIILSMSFAVSCKPEKTNALSDNLDTKTTDILVDHQEAKPADIIDSNEEILTDPKELLDSIKTSEVEVEKKPKKKKVKPKKYPQIEFEELVWDFGEIIEGDIIEKKFKFTNTGNAPLEIIATSATCGCTRPSFPFLEIAPGETNVIGVNYNSVGKDGVQEPEVTIESNTEPKTTVIKLHGTVKPKPTKDNKATLVKDSVKLKQ